MFAVTGLAFVESSSTDDKNNCTASKGLFFYLFINEAKSSFRISMHPQSHTFRNK